MTDTREVFKESMTKLFGNNKSPLGQAIAYQIWQACEAHYKERIAELEKDANYIQYMFVKGYQLSYNAPVDWLTDEANKRLAWQVVRTIKPFCDAESNRAWVGSTPKEAIENCKKAIDQAIAESKE